jgi:hypothetical protein
MAGQEGKDELQLTDAQAGALYLVGASLASSHTVTSGHRRPARTKRKRTIELQRNAGQTPDHHTRLKLPT